MDGKAASRMAVLMSWFGMFITPYFYRPFDEKYSPRKHWTFAHFTPILLPWQKMKMKAPLAVN
jgi:hypothetical protein